MAASSLPLLVLHIHHRSRLPVEPFPLQCVAVGSVGIFWKSVTHRSALRCKPNCRGLDLLIIQPGQKEPRPLANQIRRTARFNPLWALTEVRLHGFGPQASEGRWMRRAPGPPPGLLGTASPFEAVNLQALKPALDSANHVRVLAMNLTANVQMNAAKIVGEIFDHLAAEDQLAFGNCTSRLDIFRE